MKRYEFAKGKTGKILFIRVMAGGDLLQSIKEVFEQSGIVTARIASAIGSLRKVHYTFVNKNGKYNQPVIKEGMFELVTASGFISRAKGTTEMHIHSAMADSDGNIFGGHLLEEGNIVYATSEICIEELSGIRISKRPDTETGFTIFKIV